MKQNNETKENKPLPDKFIANTINGLTDGERHHLMAALSLAWSRYNTIANGGIFYDFTFKSMEEQNNYASEFSKVEAKLRTIIYQ